MTGILKYNGNSDFSDYYRIVIPVKDECGNPIGIAGRSTMTKDLLCTKNIYFPIKETLFPRRKSILHEKISMVHVKRSILH